MIDSNTKQKAQELKREYMRQWKSKNRDKVKQYQERYWERKAEQIQKESEAINRGDDHAEN